MIGQIPGGILQGAGIGQLNALAQGALAQQNAYGANQQVRKPSLLADSNRLIERLIEVSAKSERFADMLCGHAPTPIGNEAKQQGGPVESNLQLNLDMAMQWVSRIETQLERISNGL